MKIIIFENTSGMYVELWLKIPNNKIWLNVLINLYSPKTCNNIEGLPLFLLNENILQHWLIRIHAHFALEKCLHTVLAFQRLIHTYGKTIYELAKI